MSLRETFYAPGDEKKSLSPGPRFRFNKAMKIQNVFEHKPAPDIQPASMVILLHGLGANGQDLISLAPRWAAGLPETVFIAPDAPFPCDMAPAGYQWFSLREWTPESILEGVKTAAPLLQNFIDGQLEKYDLAAGRLVLMGFSQGTMMSLYAGPRYRDKIAGILGYSGALIGEKELRQSPDKFHRPPVHLIHGEADHVVPVEAYHHARAGLGKAGFDVSGHTTPGLAHGIDETGIQSGGAFLKKCLLSLK